MKKIMKLIEKIIITKITKILKLDENNQYGFGMTKSLFTGCIKIDSDISFQKLNDLI